MFKIFTMVADIHEAIDLVFELRNMTEIEGEISTKTGSFRFLNRSIPIYPKDNLEVPIMGKTYLKVISPFSEELNGKAIAKLWDKNNILKLWLIRNQSLVAFVNNTSDPVRFSNKVLIGILDLRSLGYCNANFEDIVSKLGEHFTFYHYVQEKTSSGHGDEVYCREQTSQHLDMGTSDQNPYPWLECDDPHQYQSDYQILKSEVDFKESALNPKEKARIMHMIMKYKQAFSIMDEIGECPNIKTDIKVIDESPFSVGPFKISEEDKPLMDKQMERLISVGILMQNSTSHTSPGMLITRKLTKDKRPVVESRLLNTRTLRWNTSIPLKSDVLSILGNSECEVLFCLDLKDAYHSIPLTDKSKEYCGILPYF